MLALLGSEGYYRSLLERIREDETLRLVDAGMLAAYRECTGADADYAIIGSVPVEALLAPESEPIALPRGIRKMLAKLKPKSAG